MRCELVDTTRYGSESLGPIAVSTRNGFDESVHLGAGVALGADGSIAGRLGDADLGVYPRSCLKPLQVSGMLTVGLELSPEQLAVACASHNGEEVHLDVVRSILTDCGLDESSLQNTPSQPYGVAARRAARAADVAPSAIMQNCSGKHAAMLATCRVNGWSTEDYLEIDHPVQGAINAEISRLAGEEIAHVGVDGCGAPTHVLTLSGLARAFSSMAQGSLVADAMRANPYLVAGEGRDVTSWMQAVDGLVTKDGAAGVMAGALADGRAFAFKVADGSDQARQVATAAALLLLDVDAATVEATASEYGIEVLGHGEPVGCVAGVAWPSL